MKKLADLNYFSEEEQEKQKAFETKRDRFFDPVVSLFIKLKISPNFISLLGMLTLVPFAYFTLSNPHPGKSLIVADIFLAAHIVLDGIDGPLARKMGVSGAHGSFVDMICDHSGMAIFTVILSFAGIINGSIGNVYVFLYTMAIIFVISLDLLQKPFKWVFRSKYFFYLMFLVYSFGGPEYFNEALILFSLFNAILFVLGFTRIYNILKKSEGL